MEREAMFVEDETGRVKADPNYKVARDLLDDALQRSLLPLDHITINSVRYYTIRQVAERLNVVVGTVRNRCVEGALKYVVQPGLRTNKKIIPEPEFIRFIEAETKRT
jgi:hypothetical protein